MGYVGKKPADIIATAVDTTTGQFSGTLDVTGETTLSSNLNLGDNDRVIFGAGDDLQIYHDGASGASYIAETGASNLILLGTNFRVNNAANTQSMIIADDNGYVKLHYAGAGKLETTSTGIDVTGTAVTDGLTVAGNVSIDGGSVKLDGNYPTGTNNVGLGDNVLSALTSGGNNTGVGNNALDEVTSGDHNIGIGAGAVSGVTTASFNVGIGGSALNANVTGTNNTAVGHASLGNNTSSYNTAVGYQALLDNTTGNSLVAVGTEALANNTTAVYNTAIGRSALFTNTTGNSNTAVGRASLYSNTTASNNTAVGHQALTANTIGDRNVALGVQSLFTNTEGIRNTALGMYNLYANTTGDENIAVGYGVMQANTTGNYNIGIGTNALNNNTTAGENTAVGQKSMISNTTGYANVACGASSLYSNTIGFLNNCFGYGAGYHITTGSKNTILGAYNGNQGGLDIRTSDNNIVLSDGNGNPRLSIDSSGNTLVRVGTIGGVGSYNNTTGAGANVHILSSGVMVRSTSSLRYKNTVNNATHGLTELLTLRPVTYKGNNDGDTVYGGLIAEEVHDAGLTEFVQYNDDGEPDALAYGNMVSLCIKAIQELKTELDSAKARIATLEGA